MSSTLAVPASLDSWAWTSPSLSATFGLSAMSSCASTTLSTILARTVSVLPPPSKFCRPLRPFSQDRLFPPFSLLPSPPLYPTMTLSDSTSPIPHDSFQTPLLPPAGGSHRNTHQEQKKKKQPQRPPLR